MFRPEGECELFCCKNYILCSYLRQEKCPGLDPFIFPAAVIFKHLISSKSLPELIGRFQGTEWLDHLPREVFEIEH